MKAEEIIKELGETAWYCSIQFSYNTGRAVRIVRPMEVRISVDINDVFYLYIFSKKDNKRIDIIRTCDTSLDIIRRWGYGLFKTREESIKFFNNKVQNEKDHITSIYEETIKRLDKYKIE